MGKIRFVTAKDKAYEGRFREFRMGAQFWVKLCNDLRLNIKLNSKRRSEDPTAASSKLGIV